ncbi:MAG: TIGR00366 family protein, partial [Bacteroidales bacterium]|nr:TIGR00366 family protein [Bacteroidales bacterium]
MFKKIINASIKLVQNYLPEPFIFASLLTLVAFVIAMPVCRQSPVEVLENWGSGVWSLLAFSMQMALILVCGSALADSPSVKKALNSLARIAKTPITAIALVSFVSAVACWINWGFGLIVGVVFAKSIARNLKGVDYRLLIASAYSGFVVWHGGISGSVPLTIATEGEALSKATAGVITHAVPISQTIFSVYNLLISVVIILALVVVNSLMHPKKEEVVSIDPKLIEEKEPETKLIEPTLASRLENSRLLTLVISLMGLIYFAYSMIFKGASLDLNAVILLFLFLGLLLHKTPLRYVEAFTKAAVGSAGIMLQFPFYAGIMGIMTGAGESGLSLAGQISDFCTSVSNQHTFPILTFLSAGLVNVFVPSGGGQWAVQAPIMMPAGAALGVQPSL